MLQESNPRTKIVVALYPFKAVESGDLSLEKVCRFVKNSFFFLILTHKSRRILHVSKFFDYVLYNGKN
jgi:hypothetical protein